MNDESEFPVLWSDFHDAARFRIRAKKKRKEEGFLLKQSRIIERDYSYLGYHRRCRGFLAFYAYAKDVHITKDPPRTFNFAR